MVDLAQGERPHKIDGREVESKRAMPREVRNPLMDATVKPILKWC